jgi:hypothetical protein
LSSVEKAFLLLRNLPRVAFHNTNDLTEQHLLGDLKVSTSSNFTINFLLDFNILLSIIMKTILKTKQKS